MRGDDRKQSDIFSYMTPEARVPQDHPLRPIRAMTDRVLKELSPQFEKLYSPVGRPRFRPNTFCGPCCSKCSIACAVSGC
jgi:hypothetical protein